MPMFEVDAYTARTETYLVEAANECEAAMYMVAGQLTNTEWHAARIERITEIKP